MRAPCGFTTLEGVIALTIGLIYRCDVRVVPLSLNLFESAWSHLKVSQSERDCIVLEFSLHCWELTKAFQRVCSLPKIKTTKGSMGINNMPVKDWLSWLFRENIGQILSRFTDRFASVMLMVFYLNVSYLPVLKQVIGQYKNLCGRMWCFGFHKWFSTSNKNDMCLITNRQGSEVLWWICW